MTRSLTFMLLVLLAAPAARASDPCASATEKSDGPSAVALVGVGLLMAVPDYLLWVTLHEGSHAVMAVAYGGKVTKFSVLPSKAKDGSLRFGNAAYKGAFSPSADVLIGLAPKITDLLAIGTYTALLESDALPVNKWANLAVTMFAAGAVIDLAKHLPANNPSNDMVKVYAAGGFNTTRERLPFRLIHGALVLGGAVEVTRGFVKVFSKPDRAPARTARGRLKPTSGPTLGLGTLGWAGTF